VRWSSAPIAQPVTPSIQASIHQPSSTLRFSPPFTAAFIPLVPEASIGGSGVLSQMSAPPTMILASAMS
jgi:hypothetical protein